MNKTDLFSLKNFVICTLFGSLFCWTQVFSLEREYLVRMAEAKWNSTGEKNYQCVLAQVIPFYGEAKFTHKSGHKVVFDLFSDNPLMADARVVVQSEPPSWRHDDTVFEIAKLNFKRGHNPLTVKSPYASRMLQQVENGMAPVILYRDLADGRDIIAVMLSPINFRKALAEYRECEKTLMDFDLDEIKNLNLYFATNKAILTERSKRDLKNVIRYLKMDPSILQIKVDAHADARGRRRFNDKLSERRSEAVINYLISVGAKKEMIYAFNHGEREPQYSNKTNAGRSKNRRADVQLLTTPPPTPEEQQRIEEARKAEIRNQLTQRSLYNRKVAESQTKKAASKTDNAAASTVSDTKQPESKVSETAEVLVADEGATGDDEPPAPNFINFDHLVDKNNQKLESE